MKIIEEGKLLEFPDHIGKDGTGPENVFYLESPNMGVYPSPMIWKEVYDFSPDSVLLCLSIEKYETQELYYRF